MVALVSVETVLLVLLALLVAGLLRSHAEILRRLGPDSDRADLPPPPAGSRTGEEASAAALTGTTPEGDPVALSLEGAGSVPTLLAFLTTGCTSCAGFWETLGERRLPQGVQTVIVTKGSEREATARVRSLSPPEVPVVMSSQAWSDYRVPGAPYFVLVDGVIRGEGVATTWQAMASLVSDAIEDQREAASQTNGVGRARQVDQTFAAAGIGPDHPSLRPGRERPQ